MNDTNPLLQSRWLPVLLLTGSNIFMTIAWYGHLRHRDTLLWKVILISWGIAFFEYVLQVPANRWGSYVYSPSCSRSCRKSSRCVFTVFAFLYLNQRIHWNPRRRLPLHHRRRRFNIPAQRFMGSAHRSLSRNPKFPIANSPSIICSALFHLSI